MATIEVSEPRIETSNVAPVRTTLSLLLCRSGPDRAWLLIPDRTEDRALLADLSPHKDVSLERVDQLLIAAFHANVVVSIR